MFDLISLTSSKKQFKILLIFFVLLFLKFAYAFNPSDGKPAIKKIDIITDRVNESVIRNKLSFKEGDILDMNSIEKSKHSLYSLGLLKSLKITQEWDENLQGVKVTVEARDGWFVLPWAFGGSKAKTKYVGGMLMEQNIFKHAERMMFFCVYGDNISMNMINFSLADINFKASAARRSYTDYLYSDGAYNSENEPDKMSKYGEPVNFYAKEMNSFTLNTGKSVSEKIKASITASFIGIKYDNPYVSNPADTGKIHSLQVSLNYGINNFSKEFMNDFGRMFGLGMADLDDKLKSVRDRKTEAGIGAAYETAGNFFGSDYEFNKASLFAGLAEIFSNESKLSLGIKAGYGFNLPFSQMFAANRKDGMLGVYSREFRGDKMALANLSYKYSFFKNRKGFLMSEIFAESAAVWLENVSKAKNGAGFNLFYRFWRFPIPLGCGYTYNFEDNDWQASFSIGGMF